MADKVGSSTPPRRPDERQEYRRSLHKSSCSPSWKGAYRERCKKRLKENREKFLKRYRNTSEVAPLITSSLTISPLVEEDGGEEERVTSSSESSIAWSVEEVVREEWKHVRMEYGNLPDVPLSKRSRAAGTTTSGNHGDVGFHHYTVEEDEKLADDVELVLSIMDDLTEELIKEEQALLAEYEADLRFNEDALCDAIHNLCTDDIICPICQKDYLHQNKHVIFCSCGVRLDTANDGISLSYMRKQLDHYSLEHSSQCRTKPQFSVETVVHTQTIIMTCPTCCFMEIIV